MKNPLDTWNELGTTNKLIVLVIVLLTLPVSIPILAVLIIITDRNQE